ncbi:MAG: hypothetical protein JNM84_16210 [Planctomycetes bacterium]|nr:hypothetical protein [Planctomycetota bacterium]
MSNILHLRPRGWFSRLTDVLAAERVIATLELSFFKDQGRAEIDGVSYELEHPQLFGRDYTMRRAGKTVLATRASGLFRPDYPFEHQGRRYVLARQSFWSHRLVLRDERNAEIGSIAPDGLLTRRATAELPEELPLPLRVFAIWLALAAWRQRRRRS